jgi:hypothetical protein
VQIIHVDRVQEEVIPLILLKKILGLDEEVLLKSKRREKNTCGGQPLQTRMMITGTDPHTEEGDHQMKGTVEIVIIGEEEIDLLNTDIVTLDPGGIPVVTENLMMMMTEDHQKNMIHALVRGENTLGKGKIPWGGIEREEIQDQENERIPRSQIILSQA